ncbi:mechanosensitive ion channel family protein [Nesterenkonia sp. F]|uniref:mechanosensitive ion channel family protein n=1 Tax=Nesterenkonia sp. F TaxID=795955 RepID=UPI0011129212|nr:mechanosensitive ion channel family protein [Nesterenkonia sp. F]
MIPSALLSSLLPPSPLLGLLAGGEAPEPADGATGGDPAEEVSDVVEDNVPQDVETLVTGAGPVWGLLLGVGIALVLALVVTLLTSVVAKQLLRRIPAALGAVDRTRPPLFLTLLLVGSRIAISYAAGDAAWSGAVGFVLVVLVIIGLAWWAVRIVRVVEAVVLAHYGGDGNLDDRRGRRVQTQVSLIRRVLMAVIITVAVASMLLLIPQVRALGAGLLASAGVLSVVAGIAMQSTLSNVVAGVQLAFTDTIRVGDVIVVEDNFATVEDITLSVVVLKVWDDRRIIYPSSYFVATPFENWTRVGTQLMGTVELDVDWRVPMDALRGRLRRLLESTELWDGRDYGLQVTDASAGMVKVWVVLSARNSAELWDLRCLVREDLVNYLRAEHPYAVLTQRMLVSHDDALSRSSTQVRTGALDQVDDEADPDEAAAGGSDAESRSRDAAESRPTTAPLDVVPGASGWPTSADVDDQGSSETADTGETPLAYSGEGASLFTGSIAAVERGRDFTGPGDEALRERRERQEEHDGLVTEAPEDAEGAEGRDDGDDGDGEGERPHRARERSDEPGRDDEHRSPRAPRGEA